MAAGATRERILDAAEDLFFNDGIATTGVDRVADAAGVAIATLYKHVGSKDGLLEAVLARRLGSWTEHWDAALASAPTPEDRLLAVFDALASYRASATRTQWCCFLATASERPRQAPTDPVAGLLEQDTAMLTTRFERLAADVGLPDPADVAAQLLLLYNGALASLLRGHPEDAVVRARGLAATVVSGSAQRRQRSE
ncbi:TetR/AcrR family transcriptional regulator [Alloalcanivorax gelatiniphagus]